VGRTRAAGARAALGGGAPPQPRRAGSTDRGGDAARHTEALAQQQQLALASRIIASENGIAGLKYAMDLRGYFGGLPRLPLLPLTEEKKQQIHKLVTELEPAAVSA